jgi:hypothetical protein
MGDIRASIKITAEINGVKDKTDMWINWSPNSDGVDERVMSFFRTLGDRDIAKFQRDIQEYFAEQRKEETEKAERDELVRLKKKFENG